MREKRESFTNKIGFMLSCVGAAIGLGNIWLFSWKLGKYGQSVFSYKSVTCFTKVS